MLRKTLLICGILSTLLYIAMNIFVALQWESYDTVSQTISELSAIDAPTRQTWVLPAFLYSLLVIAFGFGIRITATQNRPLRVTGILVIINGIISLGWPFVPMHQREVLAAGGGTFSDTMHIVFSMITVLLFLLTLVFGAIAFGRRFRFYTAITIVTLFVFGILTGLDAPKLEQNLPTPFIGVWERINIAAYMIWVVVLAVILLKQEKKINATNRTTVNTGSDSCIHQFAK